MCQINPRSMPTIAGVTEPWVDAPETDRRKDKLDRGPFVKMAKDLLENLADSNDSTVFGLVGPWGSGKTSVLNFITGALDDSIHVVRFNPWSFDEERLQAELYAAIIEAFPAGSRKTLREKAVDVARRTTPIWKVIPVVGTGVSETVREFLPEKSWDSAFEDMAGTIKAARVKVLVVVDDVDRVQPKDLLLLMKTIRLLGRFPRVNYLLAYDRKSTIKALSLGLGGEEGDAQVYLEKIVQYPLDLPDPQQHFLQEIIDTALQPILARASAQSNGGTTPATRFESFYDKHMATTLTTPRACHRYTGQAVTFLQLAQGDVDPADFFAIIFLRVFYPDLYRRLPSWRGELTRKGISREVKATSKEVWSSRINDCGYKGDTIVELMEALASLFPHAFPDPFWGTNGGRFRVSDSEYFDRYFTFSLPAGDMSDAAVISDLARIRRGEVAIGHKCPETFDHPNERMQIQALKKGTRHTDHESDGQHLIDYLSAGLSRKDVDEDFRSTTMRLRSAWLASLLWHCEPWDKPAVEVFVEKFTRPVILGHCLQQNMNRSNNELAQRSVMEQSTPAPEHELFNVLTEIWNQQAAAWLLAEWQNTNSKVPIDELLAVWQYLVALEGLPKLQVETLSALEAGPLSLTALAANFVISSYAAGNYQALPSSLTLLTNQLENTVPPDQLLTLPLEEPADVPAAQGDEIPSAEQRARFAYEELMRWRQQQASRRSRDY
ncbi:P-loop NTPase fold protein [Paenarthrobacter sp. CCNWLY172]|uniref:KAP family P-loop NTPase fold protein n=2 Tax=unclassified Paenarthrobacter TaxID=2634190 RepID=UPI0030797F0F